ncbi:MAG: hypothetical protein P8J33_04290 [Pirellulaceae bacterium]|nr:hypothetical protein [Pirellulaceae bacterium]
MMWTKTISSPLLVLLAGLAVWGWSDPPTAKRVATEKQDVSGVTVGLSPAPSDAAWEAAKPWQDGSAESVTPKWYRGNLHTHSFWSDGDDFPEMIVRWYADQGYHFLALTDHNILSRGEKWMSLDTVEKRSGGQECMEKYQTAFGDDWIQTRESQSDKQVLLCSLERIRERFEKEGEFLLIEAEEISDSVNGKPIHMNASNLEQLLRPTGGASVREAIDSNLRAAAEQAERTGRQILVHLNHPNFGWAVTAEDLAAVTRNRFFEVYNGHPGVNHNGDANRPSIERMWDIVNTLRIDKFDVLPLFGLAVDDSHNYHGKPGGSHPGRGWVCVRADQLNAEQLIGAMQRGDFYASSGVELKALQFNKQNQILELEIVPAAGVTYQTQFIGTRKGYDTKTQSKKDANGKPMPGTRAYSADIGEVLATSDSLNPKYPLKGDELYVRAVITASGDHPDPSFAGQKAQAWTQPVGWEK